MSINIDKSVLAAQAIAVEFSSYISDGPGYLGKLTFELAGDKITLSAGDVHTWTLPDRLPNVVAARDYTDEDFPLLQANLCTEVLDYLQDADGRLCFEDERVKILAFADGQIGFLIVHGEPSFFDLVCGSHRYSVNEQNVDVY